MIIVTLGTAELNAIEVARQVYVAARTDNETAPVAFGEAVTIVRGLLGMSLLEAAQFVQDNITPD